MSVDSGEVDVGQLLFETDRAWPYPTYDAIRARGLTRSEFGPWVTADHRTCFTVLRDHRFGADPRRYSGYQPPAPNYFDGDRAVPADHHVLLGMDPPDHTRVRRLVSKAFTPRAIAELRSYMEEITAALVGEIVERGEVDLIADLAFPLPLAVICKILGVPAADRDAFQKWGEDLVPSLDPFQTEEQVATARRADAELTRYLDELIQAHRAAPADDLLSVMIAAEDDGDRLTPDELLGNASLILGAGFETTVNLIGNGTLALLRNPDQMARLRADASLIPNAVNELLRYDSPVQLTSRIAHEDLNLAGQHIEAGSDVIAIIGGANRDPSVFADPESLDVGRANAGDHLSFSSGTHYCLGAALARAEGEVAFSALLDRTSGIEVRGEPEPRPFMVLHGLASLPLTISA